MKRTTVSMWFHVPWVVPTCADSNLHVKKAKHMWMWVIHMRKCKFHMWKNRIFNFFGNEKRHQNWLYISVKLWKSFYLLLLQSKLCMYRVWYQMTVVTFISWRGKVSYKQDSVMSQLETNRGPGWNFQFVTYRPQVTDTKNKTTISIFIDFSVRDKKKMKFNKVILLSLETLYETHIIIHSRVFLYILSGCLEGILMKKYLNIKSLWTQKLNCITSKLEASRGPHLCWSCTILCVNHFTEIDFSSFSRSTEG